MRSCAKNAELPYSIPGAETTYQPGTVLLRNRSDREIALTLAIAHEGTTFFECTRELDEGQEISIERVTESAGDYTVSATLANGGRTEYEWDVPSDYSYPRLLVRVPSSDAPLVGCPGAAAFTFTVENTTDETQTAELALYRDDRLLEKRSVSVEADATREVSLSRPIGDFYTLVATTGAGSERAAVATCRAYQDRTTVTLDGSVPEIETTPVVWT